MPGAAKTRLIPLLGPRGAAQFHAALASDVLEKVSSLGGRVSRYFFLAGGRFPAASFAAGFTLRRQRGRDLGKRLERAFRELLARHARAVILGTDSPTLPSGNLLRALEKLRGSDAVLGPCPDGGFYLIGLRRMSRGLFDGVRWGSAWAFRDMRGNFRARDFSCARLEAAEDVDRPRDVERLAEKLARSRVARARAPSAWRFLERFFARESVAKKRAGKKAGLSRLIT